MRNRSKLMISGVILTLLAMLNANAAHAEMRIWHEAQLDDGYGMMALPEGRIWPAVTTSEGTYFLGPNGFVRTSDAVGRITAGADGALAIMNSYGVTVLDGRQWKQLPPVGEGILADAAFDPSGAMRAATSNGGPGAPVYYHAFTGVAWASSEVGNYSGGVLDLEIDGAGVASILAGRSFISQGTPGGPWQSMTLPTGADLFRDLALSADGVPGIVATTNNSIRYWTYDAMRLEWVSELVAVTSTSGPAAICFDNDGYPAVAYEADGEMHFAIKEADGTGWENSLIGSFQAMRVSLAFDAKNNPVACFSNEMTTLIEYDPIVVPEPATALLLLTAVGIFGRRAGRGMHGK